MIDSSDFNSNTNVFVSLSVSYLLGNGLISFTLNTFPLNNDQLLSDDFKTIVPISAHCLKYS